MKQKISVLYRGLNHVVGTTDLIPIIQVEGMPEDVAVQESLMEFQRSIYGSNVNCHLPRARTLGIQDVVDLEEGGKQIKVPGAWPHRKTHTRDVQGRYFFTVEPLNEEEGEMPHQVSSLVESLLFYDGRQQKFRVLGDVLRDKADELEFGNPCYHTSNNFFSPGLKRMGGYHESPKTLSNAVIGLRLSGRKEIAVAELLQEGKDPHYAIFSDFFAQE